MIDSHVRLENEIRAVPNDIRIVGGGTLELVASTLKMEPYGNREPVIMVEAGGRLLLNGTAQGRSVITDSDLDVEAHPWTDLRFRIHISPGAEFFGNYCLIENAGIGGPHSLLGTFVDPSILAQAPIKNEGDFKAYDCVFRDLQEGIRLWGGTLYLQRVEMAANWMDLRVFFGSLAVYNSSFARTSIIQNVQGFIIDNSTFASASPQGSINVMWNSAIEAGPVPTTGHIKNSVIEGFSPCLATGTGATVTISHSILKGCEGGLQASSGGVIVAEGVTIREATRGMGALYADGGTILFQNSTITDSRGADLRLDNRNSGHPTTVRIRASDWDKSIDYLWGKPSRLELVEEALLTVRVVDGGGRPVVNATVRVTNGDLTFQATTGGDGSARLWLPTERFVGGLWGWLNVRSDWDIRVEDGRGSGTGTARLGGDVSETTVHLASPSAPGVPILLALWTIGLASLCAGRQRRSP